VTTAHGLVIGKFYPPHEGHHLLIGTAAACSERVTVLVLSHEVESIPHADRVAWLREVHAEQPHVTFVGVIDDHPVDFDDPAIWDLHEAVFRAGVAAVTDEPITAVFSSEEYGPELARRLAAVAVPVDDDRGLAPVSGTAVRADPVAHWSRLAPPVRGWFARRVVVLGAESTGTTTVSHALVDALRARGGAHGLTQWVPEVCRTMAVAKLAADRAAAVLAGTTPPEMGELVWRDDEFLTMAMEQNAQEDAAARSGGPVLVCDTDAFAVAVWHERYCGAADAVVEAHARRHPLYLLTDHEDVPFEQDGFRDGEAIRPWMTDRFDEVLRASGRPFVVLRGPANERVAAGLAAIDELLDAGWGLADPLGPDTPTAS
jgi:HTH-type transcriptional regulator, transcriptional repressor of NAD biosynthesis genes